MYQKKLIVGWVFVFLTLLFAGTLFVRTLKLNPQTIIVPITGQISSIEIPFLQQTHNANNSLQNVVEQVLDNEKEKYGIVIKNLKTNEQYVLNEHQVFQSGSLYKLWIMATAYDQIKNGVLKENIIMEQDVAILNEKFNIATADAELTEGRITLSVADAVDHMIIVSDNYAALLLSEKVRLSNVAKFLITHGFSESKVGTDGSIPTTTPNDIALFFEKLYEGTLINMEYDGKMLDLLKQQTVNHKIPKYLPEDITVAHKTGEFNYFTHDAGIVYTPKGDYSIVILSENEVPSDAEELMANVSKAVYQYFMK